MGPNGAKWGRCLPIDLSFFPLIYRQSCHGKPGPIFCDEDAYLLELIRYIHLNPLRAGIVSNLEALDAYPWSGHGVLMGSRDLAGQAIDEVLLLFGKQLAACRRKYRQFVADGRSQGLRPELTGGGLRRSRKASNGLDDSANFDDRVLGSGEFVDRLRQETEPVPILPPRLSLPAIQQLVCERFDVTPASVLQRTRGGAASMSRAVLCYVAVRWVGVAGNMIGQFLSMGSAAVSRAVKRGENILQERPAIKQDLYRRFH